MLEAIRTPIPMRANEHRAPARHTCRALAGSMAVLGLVAACGPREPPLVSPGTSTANAIGTGSPPAARDAAVKWEGFAALGSYRAMGKPFVSRGHFAGRWQAEVLVSQDASSTYAGLSRSSRFSAGAVLVK